MSQRKCEYCGEPISNNNYVYLWFHKEKLMRPVHGYHITYKGNAKNDTGEINQKGRSKKSPRSNGTSS